MEYVIACHDCAAIQEMPPIVTGRLDCWQCHAVLERSRGRPLGSALACALTTLVLLVPANLMLLMRISKDGIDAKAYLASGVVSIWHQGWPLAAVVVALEAMILPFLRFGLLAAALTGIMRAKSGRSKSGRGKPGGWAGPTFRYAEMLDLWAMPDVFLIGIAIGYGRLATLATVHIGAGGWCFIGAAATCMLTRATLDRRRVWRGIEAPAAATGPDAFGCVACDLVVPAQSEGGRCPRCRQRLWRRRPAALSISLALTLGGMAFYPVANLYPLSILQSFAGDSPHRLYSAVEKLAGAHLWFLAGCVFTTSIAIPFVKLVGIVWLVVSVRTRSVRHLVLKTRTFRAIDELGRWSTMDIFTVAVYLPLIQFGQLAHAKIGIGLPALLAVVVLTMLASERFDPRLLWDAAKVNPKVHPKVHQ